jgi:hypothetical protein
MESHPLAAPVPRIHIFPPISADERRRYPDLEWLVRPRRGNSSRSAPEALSDRRRQGREIPTLSSWYALGAPTHQDRHPEVPSAERRTRATGGWGAANCRRPHPDMSQTSARPVSRGSSPCVSGETVRRLTKRSPPTMAPKLTNVEIGKISPAPKLSHIWHRSSRTTQSRSRNEKSPWSARSADRRTQ